MLTIVSHDAGGAEILSSYVRRSGVEARFVLDGPARTIFRNKLGTIEEVQLSDALPEARTVLCGSSWQSDLEVDALAAARTQGIPSTVFLDHWVNYRARFQRRGRSVLPDTLWVGDEWADAIARKTFPDTPVERVENPYFLDLRDALATLPEPSPRARPPRILFVSEPVAEHARRDSGDPRNRGYTEVEALDFLLAHLEELGIAGAQVRIRCHPSGADMDYDLPRRGRADDLAYITGRTLLEDINDCDIVAGCNTMALVVGLLADKRVVSCIPPGGDPCVLPQPGITHLRRLIGDATHAD